MSSELNKALHLGIGVAFFLGVSAPALGQTAPDPAELYEQGKRLMNALDYVNGCDLLQQSYDLEPKFGRLYTLALCRDREGRGATAWTLYTEYLTKVATLDGIARESHSERASNAAERIWAIGSTMPRLKLVWRGQLPENVDVRLDGRNALPRLNAEWPQDPGEHVITVQRNHATKVWRTVTLKNGPQAMEIDLTSLSSPNQTRSSPSQNGIALAQHPLSKPQTSGADRATRPQRIVGITLSAIGASSFLAGIVMGGVAVSRKTMVDAECSEIGGKHRCSPLGLSMVDNTMTWGNGSTAALVTGSVLSGVGIGLLLGTGKSEVRTTAHVDIGNGGGFLSFKGTF